MPERALHGRYNARGSRYTKRPFPVINALQMEPYGNRPREREAVGATAAVRPIAVWLYGGLDIQIKGTKVSFPTRHGALLFAYLAAHPGVARTRAHLAGLLWGDRGEEQARGSLRQTIFRVRRVFAGIEPEVILADGQSVSVNPAAVWTDIGAIVANEESAVDYAEGEFLAGWDGVSPDMDDWLRIERDRAAVLAHDFIIARADQAEAEGDFAGLAELARRLCARDPYDEDAARRLMIGLALTGQTAAAEEVFRKLTELLLSELQIEPSSETAELASQIAQRQGRFGPRRIGQQRTIMLESALAADAVRERRLVTVLAAWAEPEPEDDPDDPESTLKIRRRCEAAFGEAIAQHGGTVDRAPGLISFSYFGWPVASEHAAKQATEAALAIRRITACRIGISSGEVLIEPGLDPVGAAPDQAVRLMTRAHPGQIMISATTRVLIRGKFEIADGPAGISSVVRELPPPTRFSARDPEKSAELVGRARELDLVRDRLERANEGEGQLVVVMGEPGIGKSRLQEEVAHDALALAARRVLLQCSPRHEGTPFQPVREHIRFAAGLAAALDRETASRKLHAHLEEAGVTDPGDVDALVQFLDTDHGTALQGGDGARSAEQRAATLAALGSYFLGARGNWLTFVVLEDAHWADPSTLELFGNLCRALDQTRLLLLVTARNEFDRSVFPDQNRTDLTLGSLSRGDAHALIGRHLAASDTGESLVSEIIAQADGVPLFLIELARWCADGAWAEPGPAGHFDMPPTLKSVLEARLDRLGTHRRVAQRAACVGRQFDRSALLAACGHEMGDVDAGLEAMLLARLVFRYPGAAGEEFSFQHGLIAETAYESLAADDRRETHLRLLDHFQRASDTPLETVARQAALAEQHRLALDHYLKAGLRALAGFAHLEARAHFEAALTELTKLEPSPSDANEDIRLEILGKLCLCSAHALGYGHPDTVRHLDEARRLAGARPSSRFAIPVLWQTYSLHYTYADGERVRTVGEQVLNLREWSDAYGPQEALGNRFVAAGNLLLGRFDAADAAFRKASTALRQPGAPTSIDAMGIEQSIPIGLLHARVLAVLGRETEARTLIDETFRSVAETGLVQPEIVAHVLAAQTMLVLLDFKEAERLSAISLAQSRDRKTSMWAAYSRCILGISALHGRGTTDEVGTYWTGRDALRRSQTIVSTTLSDALFAAGLARTGRLQEARSLFEQVVRAVDDGREPWCHAEVFRLDAETGAATGRHDAAEVKRIRRAAKDLAETQGAELWRSRLERDEALDP